MLISRLQERLNTYNMLGQRQYKLSFSIGLARYDLEHPCSIEELLELGDKLMYEQMKRKVMNRIE